jgi:import inner membrane translocase subunit TIM10
VRVRFPKDPSSKLTPFFLSSQNRLVDTCTKKCIPPQYREADLNKGESVCLDRCVSKFFEVNVKVSEKMQGEAQAKQGGGFA